MKAFAYRHVALSLITCSFAWLAMGCSEAKKGAEDLAAAVGSSELQHKFQDEQCREPLALQAIGGSRRPTLEFTGDDLIRTEQYFAEADCKDAPAVSVVYRGKFTKRDEVQSDVHQLDLSYTSAVVIPQSEAGVNLLNAFNLCGVSNWVVGQAVDVTAHSRDATCPVANLPQAVFDIYTVQNDVLFLGKGSDEDKATAEKRATELDRGNGFRKAD